ncbi:MAG: ATP-binding cassette domain-containing protein, partial [Candidatus Competibacteraceae bacterium]|nr:ATP-binding cassette domain-containing protein [Candidatus Competibacteraceae bacterium]
MLRIDDITFAMAGRPLFEGAGATIPDGHKVGLVGRNGTGKTTTIGKLAAKLAADGKQVMLAAGDTFRAAA